MGIREEKALAKRLRGRRVPRSGGLIGHRGDVVVGEWMIEEKGGRFNKLKSLWDSRGGEGKGLDVGWAILQEFSWPLEFPTVVVSLPLEDKRLRTMWAKISKEAMGSGKEPLLLFSRYGLCLRRKP